MILTGFKIYWSLGMLLMLVASFSTDFRQQHDSLLDYFGGSRAKTVAIGLLSSLFLALIWPILLCAPLAIGLTNFLNRINGSKK